MKAMEDFFKEHTVPFGTFWKKLVRKNAPETSIDAAERVNTTKLEKIVYEAIKTFPDGCISDQVQDVLDMYAYSSVTSRFSALALKGYIKYTGETRKGRSGRNQRVMIAV